MITDFPFFVLNITNTNLILPLTTPIKHNSRKRNIHSCNERSYHFMAKRKQIDNKALIQDIKDGVPQAELLKKVWIQKSNLSQECIP